MSLRNQLTSVSVTRTIIESDFEAQQDIRVFTSKRCEFSKVALEHVRYVIQDPKYQETKFGVVEESIDNNPSLLEDYNIVALPMTVIGDYYLIGIPSTRDLEVVLNKIIS